MSDDVALPLHQPILVRIAVVLVYLSGFASVAVGILVLLSRYRVEKAEVLPVSLLGAGIILFGLLSIAVASGVARGRRLARLILTIYLAAQFVLRGIAIASADAWDLTSLAEMALYLFIVIALWTPPGSRYFRADPVDRSTEATA